MKGFWLDKITSRRGKKRASLKEELFLSVTLFSGLVLAVFGFLFAYFLYSYETDRVQALLEQRNAALKYFVEARFLKIRNMVEFLSEIHEIRNAPTIGTTERERVLALYRRLKENDPDINYVYSGYIDGSLLINNYAPPEGYDSRTRPWYRAALDSYPEVSDGIPYIEVKTGEWLVSISKALIDEQGEINGVTAIDSSLDAVCEMLKKGVGSYESMYSYVVKTNGEVIIHHDRAFLGKKFQEVVNSPVTFEKSDGHFTYYLNDAEKLAYYSRIDPLGWIVITAVKRGEILRFIIGRVLAVIAMVGVITLFLGWLLSGILGSKVISPILKLKERAEKIVEGNQEEDFTSQYPENEIGAVLSDIEQLTQNELYRKNLQLKAANRRLEELSFTDQLTSLFNRRRLYAELEKELERTKRYDSTFSVIMFDLDNFKDINDTFGHQTGDKLLMEVASLIKKVVRSVDVISRWGGDEFLILCPETGLSEACRLAERLREKIAEYSFPRGIQVTVSVGVCEFSSKDNPEQLLSKVDEALYRAKSSGKNTVVS